MNIKERLLVLLIYTWFEAFILIPLHGRYLEKHCKKECTLKCKMWNCPKWHYIKEEKKDSNIVKNEKLHIKVALAIKLLRKQI